MQDNRTMSHTNISTYCLTKDNAKVTAELLGHDWHNERLNMTSRLAYLYPEWVHRTRYPEGYWIPRFSTYSDEACPGEHLVRFSTKCGSIFFTSALLLKQFPLSLPGVVENWLFTLPQLSIENWDVLARQFIKRSTRLNPPTQMR